MDDTWVESDDERFIKHENERECEFLVSVEIYISNAAGAAFRKVCRQCLPSDLADCQLASLSRIARNLRSATQATTAS